MAEDTNRGIRQRWEEFQPTKAMLAWTCVGSVVATIAVGFFWGGWVTGGTAQQMASNAAADSRAELAAVICADRFMSLADAQAQLTEFHEISSSFQKRQFVERGGWAVMPDRDAVSRRAADLCAEKLAVWEPSEAADASAIQQ